MLPHYADADVALMQEPSLLPPPPPPPPPSAGTGTDDRSAGAVTGTARLLLLGKPAPSPHKGPPTRRRAWKQRTFSDPGPWAPTRDGVKAAAAIAAAADRAGAGDGSFSDVSNVSAADSGIYVSSPAPSPPVAPSPSSPVPLFYVNLALEPEEPCSETAPGSRSGVPAGCLSGAFSGPSPLPALPLPAAGAGGRRRAAHAADMEIQLDPLALAPPPSQWRVADSGPVGPPRFWPGQPEHLLGGDSAGAGGISVAFDIPVVSESFLKRTCHERFFKKICAIIIVIVFSGVVAMVVVPYIMAKK
ncbi:uncharacterized protein LOC116955420 isoform X2 [Petromyzon marinus]